MKVKYLILLIIIIITIQLSLKNSYANNENSCVNCKLINGKKNGLCIEKLDSLIVYAYYKNGLRNGVCVNYDRINGKVISFSEYKNGDEVVWYQFDLDGHLLFKGVNCEKNTKLTVKGYSGKRVKYPYKIYIYFYYLNGIVKEEGIILFDDSPLVDSEKKGLWKYYDSNGKYKKSIIHDGEVSP